MLTRRGFVAVVAGGIGATTFSFPRSASAQVRKLKVGMHPIMVSPMWNALQLGLFKKHGIDIEFVGFTTGPSQTAALQGGIIDLAWGAATTFYTIRSSGAPVRWTGTVGNFNHADGMVVGPGSPIKSVEDLKGKTIALPFFTVVHGPLLLLLQKHNVPLDSVKLINLAPPQASAAVLSGTADAAFAWPPFINEVVDRGGRVLLHAADTPGGGWSWTGFAANVDWANANLDLLADYYRAFDAGREGLDKNREKIIQTAVSVGGMPEPAARKQFDQLTFPPLVNNVTVGTDISMCSAGSGGGIAQTLDQARAFYQKTGQVKSPVPYSEYLFPDALNKVFGKECRV